MLILAIRTDKPEAELYLLESLDADAAVSSEIWQAHRQLAETIHSRIKQLLAKSDKTAHDITGIIVFRGPGSFTGLRIGVSVANALAVSLDVPIAGASGNDWLKQGLNTVELTKSAYNAPVLPHYGGEPHITTPRK
jgi:tRNA threonylcarbamoyladenosine biosynthesis protein TsaB